MFIFLRRCANAYIKCFWPLSSVPTDTSIYAAAYNVERCFFFVRFSQTPNDACYKFFVDDVVFLPGDNVGTLCFDLNNCHQSPLAEHILCSLPMVSEVTIGQHFVTVRRVDDENAGAAARYFAQKIGASSVFKGENAKPSLASQQCVTGTMEEKEDEIDGCSADNSRSLPHLIERQRHTLSSSASFSHQLAAVGKKYSAKEHSKEGQGPELQKEDVINEHPDEAALRDLVLLTNWNELKLHVSAAITDHLFSGRPHVDPSAPHPHVDTLPQDGDSEVVVILKELIATTIRPQLQHDGGDIRFVCFDDGTMYVEMLGACRNCRSSKKTLRDLIERTTRHWVPEVVEVRELCRDETPEITVQTVVSNEKKMRR